MTVSTTLDGGLAQAPLSSRIRALRVRETLESASCQDAAADSGEEAASMEVSTISSAFLS